jgi:hypothetical protein
MEATHVLEAEWSGLWQTVCSQFGRPAPCLGQAWSCRDPNGTDPTVQLGHWALQQGQAGTSSRPLPASWLWGLAAPFSQEGSLLSGLISCQ